MPSLVRAAKHAGRKASKYALDVEVHSASGLPERHGFVGVQVQLSRGPKLSATEEVELRPEQRTGGGTVVWSGAKVSMMATLYASKTGKVFSDKRYRISLIGVRPAAFGTTKRSTRELAHAELNASDWTTVLIPKQHRLELPIKGRPAEPPIVLAVSIGMRCIKADYDEDDDAGSISSAMTGFSRPSNSVMSEAVAEQDLDGFTEAQDDPLVALAAANAKFGLTCTRKAAASPPMPEEPSSARGGYEDEDGGGGVVSRTPRVLTRCLLRICSSSARIPYAEGALVRPKRCASLVQGLSAGAPPNSAASAMAAAAGDVANDVAGALADLQLSAYEDRLVNLQGYETTDELEALSKVMPRPSSRLQLLARE